MKIKPTDYIVELGFSATALTSLTSVFCENSIKLTFDTVTQSISNNIQKEFEELAGKKGFNLGTCKVIPADNFCYHLRKATLIFLNNQICDNKMKKIANDILKTCQGG